jgi:hypothetical protein
VDGECGPASALLFLLVHAPVGWQFPVRRTLRRLCLRRTVKPRNITSAPALQAPSHRGIRSFQAGRRRKHDVILSWR